jgi:hypothetical protein
MVVVADAGLVPCDRVRGLDASHQSGFGQSAENVVHGLVGDVGELAAGGADDRVRVGVRLGVHRIEHRDPGPGDAQARLTQRLLEIGSDGHTTSLSCFPE